MRFRFKSAGIQLVVLLWGSIATAGSGNQATSGITVVVNNSASVSASVLSQAELETGRIFGAAGIEITWLNCRDRIANTVDVCSEVPGNNEFVLHIVPTGRNVDRPGVWSGFSGRGRKRQILQLILRSHPGGALQPRRQHIATIGNCGGARTWPFASGFPLAFSVGNHGGGVERGGPASDWDGDFLFYSGAGGFDEGAHWEAGNGGDGLEAVVSDQGLGVSGYFFCASCISGRRESTETPRVPPEKPSM